MPDLSGIVNICKPMKTRETCRQLHRLAHSHTVLRNKRLNRMSHPLKDSLGAARDIAVYIGRELTVPAVYVTGGAVGLGVNALMGVFSPVPFIVPILVQTFVRGILKYQHRFVDQLANVPAMRPDPTFIMDDACRIVLSAGVTKETFQKHGIENIAQLVDQAGAMALDQAVRACTPDTNQMVVYSPVLSKHYEASVVPTDTACSERVVHFVVWFKDVTPRILVLTRQKDLLDYFNELLEGIQRIARKGTLRERLARHILETYEAVFITTLAASGEMHGHIFKMTDDALVSSQPIVVATDSDAPVRLSSRAAEVVQDFVTNYSDMNTFHAKYHFDPRVKEFIGSPINGFVNYHRGDVAVIAFNPLQAKTYFDEMYFETLVSVSRSMIYLSNLAHTNHQKSLQTVMGLSAASEFSDEITGRHILRVAEYSRFLAREMGGDEEYVENVGLAAPLHDVGKVAMPELIKHTGKYDEEMRRRMEMHTVIGANIIGRMIRFTDTPEPWLSMAYNVALHHHQTYAGSGYPCSTVLDVQPGDLSPNPEHYSGCSALAGDQIPLEGLIVGLADRYDALRSARQYKPEFSHEKAMAILERDDRVQTTGEEWYGPRLWKICRQNSARLAEIYDSMRDDPGGAA
jgi:response regulator RpfG family c-di-GMP phosphodiesterase